MRQWSCHVSLKTEVDERGCILPNGTKENPLNPLLRARLRINSPARKRLWALRMAMSTVDAIGRVTSGAPFFNLRESQQILQRIDGIKGPELVRALMSWNGGTDIRAIGLENIPKTGAVVIGSTHPIGTFDFLAHASCLFEHRPDLKVVANREAQRFLGPERIIAVDFDRKDNVLTARQTRQGMLAHLQAGGALLVFGSGKVPDCEDGVLVEPPWRSGVTRMSAAAGAPIIPASPDMRNSEHYYRTRRWARRLSGSARFGREVASLRYVSELIAKLGGSYSVHYGEALPPGTAPEVLKQKAEALVSGLYDAS